MLLDFFQIRPQERRLFAWSAGWFSTVLAAYYIVRPVREAMGSIEGRKQLPWLFTATFVTMLVAVPIYSKLVSIFSRQNLVPIIYRFLGGNLILFSIAMSVVPIEQQRYVARIFFVWVAVYVLFMTSLFWSVMADIYSRADGKRLFGTIAGFGTVGSILASSLVGISAGFLGAQLLLILSAALMEVGLWCFRHLMKQKASLTTATADAGDRIEATDVCEDDEEEEGDRPGRNPFAGFVRVVLSPYLRSIMLFTLCTTCCGTFLYLTQAEMLKQAYPDNDVRTAAFAKIDLAVQVLTLFFQLLVASRLMKFSLTLTLCSLPMIYVAASLGLAVTPSLAVLVAAMILSRAATYGLAVPSVGVLYTIVSREDKYKAKSVIDTLVIRGGDVGCNWTISMMREAGRSASAVAWAVFPVALFSVALACLLSFRNGQARAVAARNLSGDGAGLSVLQSTKAQQD